MLGFVGDTVRTILSAAEGAESELPHMSPLVEGVHGVEEKVHMAVDALHHTSATVERNVAAIDRHVEVLETLVTTLPALTESVTRLSDQIALLLELAAPVERVEQEIGVFGRLLHRGRRRKPALPTG